MSKDIALKVGILAQAASLIFLNVGRWLMEFQKGTVEKFR